MANLDDFKEKFIMDVFDESSTEEMQLFVVQANELDHNEVAEDEGALNDAEFDKFFEEARKSYTLIMEEEAKQAQPKQRAIIPIEEEAMKK